MKNERRYDLDWLRVIAFYLLIIYHTALIFVSWEFHIKNKQISEIAEPFLIFLNQWRLPLLFLISGIGVHFALKHRLPKVFIKERSTRLMIPLLFGMFVIVPPQIYFEHLQNSVDYSSYFDFYKTVFNFVAYPEGSFSWHHLWFLPYLFSYSVIGLPLFLFLKSEKGEILLEKVARFLAIKGTLFLAVIPLALTYGFLRLDWPDNRNLIQDWYNFTFYFLIFLYGYIICSYQKFWSIIENNRFISLVVAIISVTILYLFAWTPIYDYFSYKDNTIYLYGFLKSLNIWAWLMVILGFSSKLLNKPSNMLSYLNESVYPFYILHQTIIVVLGYYIVQWEISSTEKFLLLVFITFTLCFTFYELLIRHTRITRFVFGLKTKETIKAKNR